MRVSVCGLWHLGSVTAGCAADLGHDVVGYDDDAAVVNQLREGQAPIGEPGLDALIRQQVDSGRLRFSSDLTTAVQDADVVWITTDTPVDEEDRADVASVIDLIERTFNGLSSGAVVLVSSQLPVGSIAALERRWQSVAGGRVVDFACAPENLRLGRAIDTFMNPERIVVGVAPDREHPRTRITKLFGPLSERILWMSPASAEMTKHAINAFLAASVTFINEIASLCEAVAADAGEVERGLKTEGRIGPKAYLASGAAFAGGTLARDVTFLRELGDRRGLSTALLDGLADSNARHRSWALRRLEQSLGDLRDHRVAVAGLTYKPGTTTLRRSDGVALCRQLLALGARVAVHDPTVHDHPPELPRDVEIADGLLSAATGADALVVSTGWPEFKSLSATDLVSCMKRPLVIDAARVLAGTLGDDPRLTYLSVGRAAR